MWDNARQLNMIALIVAFAAATMLAWGAVAWAVRQPVFAFQRVVIDGPLQRANPAHLEAVIREELKGTFFTMRLDDAQGSLQRVPWVRRVALRRRWPDRLEVEVSEHQPLARWNDAALVDAEGDVFAADFDGDLPQFTGPEGTAAEVAAQYRAFGAALQPTGRAISAIRRSPRGGWQIVAAGSPALTIELGRAEPGEHLSRFVAHYRQTLDALSRGGARIDYADLRYRNGFAARVSAGNDRSSRKASRG
ncbi:MAG: cell division protein FtsQ/DivIB [Burkholderiales bacterium]|jgi:cell division protein FtsQ